MPRTPASQVRQAFRPTLDGVRWQGRPVVITKHNEPAAVLAPWGPWADLWRGLALAPELVQALMEIGRNGAPVAPADWKRVAEGVGQVARWGDR